MRTLVRCVALAPVAILLLLLVATHLAADWLEEREAARDRGDDEGALHA